MRNMLTFRKICGNSKLANTAYSQLLQANTAGTNFFIAAPCLDREFFCEDYFNITQRFS